MRIPGIPGASEPSFRTRDQVWIALDDLVYETCTKLEVLGIVLSPYACKAAIQVRLMPILCCSTVSSSFA